MKKVALGLTFSIVLALLVAGVVAADEYNGNNTTAEHTADFPVCLSAVFVLLIVLIAISLVIIAFSRAQSR